jgi:prolyl-tRNA synthetase
MSSTKEQAIQRVASMFSLSAKDLQSQHAARMRREGAQETFTAGPAGRLLSNLSAHADRSAKKSILDKLNEEIQEVAEDLGVEPEVLMELIRQKLEEDGQPAEEDPEERMDGDTDEEMAERRKHETQEDRAGTARARNGAVSPEIAVARAFHLDPKALRTPLIRKP